MDISELYQIYQAHPVITTVTTDSQEDTALWAVAAVSGNHWVRLVNLIEF